MPGRRSRRQPDPKVFLLVLFLLLALGVAADLVRTDSWIRSVTAPAGTVSPGDGLPERIRQPLVPPSPRR